MSMPSHNERFMKLPNTARRLFQLLVTLVPCYLGALEARASSVLEKEVVFNLPPQQVEDALLGFSEQAHVQVLTASAAIPDRRAAEVSGRMRVRVALESILRDTGLGYSMLNEDTIAIQAAAKNPAGAGLVPEGLPTSSPVVRTSNTAPIRLAQAEDRPEPLRSAAAGPARHAESNAV